MYTLVDQSKAMFDVSWERQRQINLGYDATHDDEHETSELLLAAISKLMNPWGGRKEWIKAAALVVAAVERQDREDNVL